MIYNSKPYQESIVQIYDKYDDIIGTGVIIAQKYVLTCGHLVCDALSIDRENIESTISKKITLGLRYSTQNSKQQAKVLHAILNETSEIKNSMDIALLLLDEKVNIPNYPLVQIEKNNLELAIFGFDEPDGRWVKAEYRGENFLGWGQLNPEKDNKINKGFSGSPVWDEENIAIVGIIVAKRNWNDENQDIVEESYMILSSAILQIDEFKKYLGNHAQLQNPYKGLSFFGEKDSQFYFGRNDEINNLIPKLSPTSQYNFFSIIGISGVGKSSFINAGLIPKLKNNFRYTVISFRPSNNPFEEIVLNLLNYLEDDKTEHATKMRKLIKSFSDKENTLFLRDQLKILSKDISPIILIIDQFEELFTNSTLEIQSFFLIQLLEVIKDKDLPTKVIISMRVDFLDKLLTYPQYTKLLNDDTKHFIGDLATEKLREVIVEPAKKQNIRFEDGLIERLLSDIKNEKGQLPLLEFALTKLWEKQEYGVITHKALDELGGAVASLGQYAKDIFNQFKTKEEQEAVRRVMIQLVHPGLGQADTRQIATLNNFIDEDRTIITKLADKRLIVTGTGEGKEQQQVEIIHEALISQWSTLKEWIGEYREFRLWQNKLRLTIEDWEKDELYDESYLLRGRQLEEAEEKLKAFPKELEPDKDFIEKSIEARNLKLELEELETQKKLKRNRQIKIGVTSFVIALSLTTGFSIYQKNIANDRLSTIERQNNQVIWTYWSSFLDADRQDEKIDNPKLLNTVLNVLDYSTKNKEEAVQILLRDGVVKIKQEKPFLSKNFADFLIYLSRLYAGDTNFFNNNIDDLSTHFIWLWNNDEINLFSNFLARIINKETPYIINIEAKHIEKYKYLLTLMNFISKPTEKNLQKLVKFKYFFTEEDSDKKIGGLEAILDYENKIVSNHFHFKKTKLVTKESEEIFKYFSEKIRLSNNSDKEKTIIINNYKEALNAYFNTKKSKLSKKEVVKIVKIYLNRVQRISEVLYKHSQKNPNKYSSKQKQKIGNMYYNGIYNIGTDTISQKNYPDLNKTLVKHIRVNYFNFKKQKNVIGMQKELEKILKKQPNNPWALERLNNIFFEKFENNEKSIKLFSKDKNFLKEWKKTINLVLNNQNINMYINDLGDKEKRSLADMYGYYAFFYKNKKNYHRAILNANLQLKYIINDKKKIEIYGNLSWWYLFVKEYQKAIDSAKRVFKSDKSQIWVQGNLAHAYLLNNQKTKAIEIYRQYKGYKILSSKELWENTVREDFQSFKDANITSPYFDEIEKLLFSSSD